MLDLNANITRQTSAQAHDAFGAHRAKKIKAEILDIVIAAARHGVDDLSGREIQQRYELQHGKRIEASTISSRVNDLIASGLLERAGARPCKVTGNNIAPVRAVAHQVRLTA